MKVLIPVRFLSQHVKLVLIQNSLYQPLVELQIPLQQSDVRQMLLLERCELLCEIVDLQLRRFVSLSQLLCDESLLL